MGKPAKSASSENNTGRQTRQPTRSTKKDKEKPDPNDKKVQETNDNPDRKHAAEPETPITTSPKKPKAKQDSGVGSLSLPPEYNNINNIALKNFVDSVNKAHPQALKGKGVKDNFKDLQEIIEGLTIPIKEPTTSEQQSKKRKRSARLSETDTTGNAKAKDTEAAYTKLQSEHEALKKELQQLRSSHDKMLTENKLLKRQEIESKKKITSYGQKSKDPAKVSGTLKADVNCNNEKIIFQTKLKEAEATLQKKCEQLQNKNEELESLSHELIEGRERLNTKTKECDELKSKLEKNRMELDELRNRFSAVSASKLDGNASLTDLGDPNRPMKLVERFTQLYDNLWTDVYGELCDSYDNEKEKEKLAVEELLSVFKKVQNFCENTAAAQEKSIAAKLMFSSQEDYAAVKSAINNIRKSFGERVVPCLIQQYWNHTQTETSKSIKDFIDESLSLCWLAEIQDPPLAFDFDYQHGSHFDKNVMKEFTNSGDKVDYVVWPTLRLHKDGPIMIKGVVQPIRKHP